MFRKAKAQGAVVGYAHAIGGGRDPVAGNLGGAKEFAMDAALGALDTLEWASSSRASLLVWHHALNNDFRIAPVGGEDAKLDFQRHTLTGSMRTYAYTGKNLTGASWIDAIRAGRTFFSNGPLLEFKVNGRLPGDSIKLPREWWRRHIGRKNLDHPPAFVSGDFIQRESLETDCSLWRSPVCRASRASHSFRQRLVFFGCRRPGWRGRGRRSSPAGSKKIRNRASAEYFVRWIDKLQPIVAKTIGWRSQQEKDKVFAQLSEARRAYEQLKRRATDYPNGRFIR
jgi:hypothetical protein